MLIEAGRPGEIAVKYALTVNLLAPSKRLDRLLGKLQANELSIDEFVALCREVLTDIGQLEGAEQRRSTRNYLEVLHRFDHAD